MKSNLSYALVIALATCSACTGHETRSSVAPPFQAQPASRHKLKKHRVLFGGFKFEPSAHISTKDVAHQATQRCEAALQRDTRLVCVDALDVEIAPAEFQPLLYDYRIQGVLVLDGERVVSVKMRATSPREAQFAVNVESACEPMQLRAPAIERLGVDALIAQVSERLLQRAWSTGVLDKAERQLIVGGGAATGIALGEKLVVRKIQRGYFERGIENWLDVPTVEVARIVVEAYVGTTTATYGAQCSLTGGSFGGFNTDELVVTLPDEARDQR